VGRTLEKGDIAEGLMRKIGQDIGLHFQDFLTFKFGFVDTFFTQEAVFGGVRTELNDGLVMEFWYGHADKLAARLPEIQIH
jgi:hypothetical protein